MFSEPNSFKHVFNITILAIELAKDYNRLRQLIDEAGYINSILIGPEVNHIGEPNHAGEIYALGFLESKKNIVNYVSWHQYYLNGREAKAIDFVNPRIFNWLPMQIKSIGNVITASAQNVSMWLCTCITLESEISALRITFSKHFDLQQKLALRLVEEHPDCLTDL